MRNTNAVEEKEIEIPAMHACNVPSCDHFPVIACFVTEGAEKGTIYCTAYRAQEKAGHEPRKMTHGD